MSDRGESIVQLVRQALELARTEPDAREAVESAAREFLGWIRQPGAEHRDQSVRASALETIETSRLALHDEWQHRVAEAAQLAAMGVRLSRQQRREIAELEAELAALVSVAAHLEHE